MSCWIVDVGFLPCSDRVVAALDLRNENELGFPQYPKNTTFSYFFFSFPYLNRLADFIMKGVFSVPIRHVDSLNKAFTQPNNCVYMFVSAQNSKLIHVPPRLSPHSVGDVRDEGVCREGPRLLQTVPSGVAEGGTHAVHAVRQGGYAWGRGCMVDRTVKLDKLEDGSELDKDTGDELFVWVWRHPNVLRRS